MSDIHKVVHLRTRATQSATASLVDAIEALEDARELFGCYAHTIVAEVEQPPIPLVVCTDNYRCTLAGIVDGIINKIAEDAVDEEGLPLMTISCGKQLLNDIWRFSMARAVSCAMSLTINETSVRSITSWWAA